MTELPYLSKTPLIKAVLRSGDVIIPDNAPYIHELTVQANDYAKNKPKKRTIHGQFVSSADGGLFCVLSETSRIIQMKKAAIGKGSIVFDPDGHSYVCTDVHISEENPKHVILEVVA